MKKLFLIIPSLLLLNCFVFSQETVYPTKEYNGLLFITNGTVHIGNGEVIENATIKINKGKIVSVGKDLTVSGSDAKVIDAKGKQVYPGLILSSSDLGLKEIANGVRGSNDFLEIGDLNPSVRSIVAYNTDSKIIGTLRANGILLAGITPEGGTISGTSSVVQLDAWNWEDAAYKYDNGIHLNMPSFIQRRGRFRGEMPAGVGRGDAQPDPTKIALDKIEEIKLFFREAKAYLQETTHKQTNLKFEAVKGLYDKKEKLFIHADQVKQMLAAIDFVKEFGFDVVIIGASESFLIADLLKANNIAVILNQEHALPATEDDDVDQPYKTPAALQKAGVVFALNDTHDESRYRNLSFNAGTAATYGLTKEEALQAITLNAAKILGIDDKTGSIEAGKDANIIVADGDILDMKSSNVDYAFIQGRQVSLDNKQKQLYERYKYKYNIK
ncbi:imidazolonepropionase [mine drainage metagenome]|uniref:Imidazolonepropionase n=1 Tax=mine drainage metagenome TaxID=410659 RepID=A0A1J5SI65_9ZZZZ